MANIRTQTGSFSYAKYQLTRAILENALDQNYTTDEYKAALEYFKGCAYCGNKQAPRKDHLIAVFECGDFTTHNVVPACQKCDDSKGRKYYQDWMRNCTSKHSLKTQGFTYEQIESRIKLIEDWQSGYTAKTKEQLFGEDYPEYNQLLQKMENICEEAKRLADRVRTRNKKCHSEF